MVQQILLTVRCKVGEKAAKALAEAFEIEYDAAWRPTPDEAHPSPVSQRLIEEGDRLLTGENAYNARVDHLNAIRLLQALVAAGAKPRAPMDGAWIDEIAVKDVSLHGMELASALAYAEKERWLADSRTRKDLIYLTRIGEIIAKQSGI